MRGITALALGVGAALAIGLNALANEPMTFVAVSGPADSEAPEDLFLEVGPTTWHGYGGVVSVPSAGPLNVRLIGQPSCRVYAAFEAPPGTMWVIRLLADGSARVEDWTGRGMDAGPALGERPPTACRANPEPALAAAADAGLTNLLLVMVLSVVGLVLVVGVAAFVQSRR